MPIVDFSDPALFKNNYRFNASRIYWAMQNTLRPVEDKNITLGYNRYTMLEVCRKRAAGIRDALGLDGTQSILVVGAGFGWLAEAFLELWPAAKIVSIDNSLWVHSVKDQDEGADIDAALDARGIFDPGERQAWQLRFLDGPRARVDILNEDLSSGASRSRVKKAMGQTIDLALSEDVLPWLYDDECQALSKAMGQVASKVAHFVTPYDAEKAAQPEPPPAWNWKTIEDWKLLLPNDTIIEAGTYRSV